MIAVSILARDISDLKTAERKLRQLATHDYLTGLPNRLLLYDRLELALNRYGRYGTPVALMFCDLDAFKPVNDAYGHQVGDAVLTEVADRIHSVVRDTDTAARLGGDEFGVLVEGVEDLQLLTTVAERLVAAIAPARHGRRDHRPGRRVDRSRARIGTLSPARCHGRGGGLRHVPGQERGPRPGAPLDRQRGTHRRRRGLSLADSIGELDRVAGCTTIGPGRVDGCARVYPRIVADYRPPLRDIRFVLDHLADLDGLCGLPAFAGLDPDTVKGVLEENARFVADVIAPLNRIGDIEGSRHDPADQRRCAPRPGSSTAYQQLRRRPAGAACRSPTAYGGGGFPWLVGIVHAGAALARPTWRSRWPRCSPRAPSTCSSTTAARSRRSSSCPRW